MNIFRNLLWKVIKYIDNVYAEKYIYPSGSVIRVHYSNYNYYEELNLYEYKVINKIFEYYHYSIVWILNRIYCIRGDCFWLMGLRRNKK